MAVSWPRSVTGETKRSWKLGEKIPVQRVSFQHLLRLLNFHASKSTESSPPPNISMELQKKVMSNLHFERQTVAPVTRIHVTSG